MLARGDAPSRDPDRVESALGGGLASWLMPRSDECHELRETKLSPDSCQLRVFSSAGMSLMLAGGWDGSGRTS